MALTLFFVLLAVKTAVEVWLEWLNRRHVLASRGPVPAAFRGVMDQPTYDRSIAYTLAKIRLGLVETLFDAAVLAALVASWLLPIGWEFLGGLLGGAAETRWGQALMLFLAGAALSLPGLPLAYRAQFNLEERFGFNKMTPGLWVQDQLKGFGLSLVLLTPLLWALLWVVGLPGWWVWAALLVVAFQLVMLVVYPRWIMPLFNTFEPLAEGGLRERLMNLARRTGFAAQTILVMDGSRRSAHSNAFFAGLGRSRRIVLFDTLMEQLEEAELEAVLAHEIGHYKRGHIVKTFALSAAFALASFAVLGWLLENPAFVVAFGFPAGAGLAPVLLVFSLYAGLFTFWLNPLMGRLSRRHEYEADAFAKAAVGSGQPLVGALRKLNEKNLSNLNPHPLYSGFYYSHPTLLEREAALAGAAAPAPGAG